MFGKLIFVSLLFVGSAVFALEDLPADQIAVKLCDETTKVMVGGVANIQSMIDLAGYFEQLPSDGHPLSECRNKYIESLKSLREVLTVANDDACGDAKVSVMEDFNRKFLSTRRRDVDRQKKEKLKAPKLVEVFFMHYAYLVASRCKTHFFGHLVDGDLQMPPIIGRDGKVVNEAGFDAIVQQFSKIFGLNIAKRGYSDVILPYTLIDGLPSSSKTSVYIRDPVIDAQHPVPVRISVQVNGPEKFRSIQRACRTHFKPIYSGTVLPVIRLVGMGLYRHQELVESIVKEREAIRRLFSIAQFCETILTVETFDDPSMKPGHAIVLTVESADALRASQPLELQERGSPVTPMPSAKQSLVSVKTLSSLEHDTESVKELVKVIVANRKDQERVIGRFGHIAFSYIKSHVSRFSSFLKGTSSDGSSVEVALESPSKNSIVRSKRSLKETIVNMLRTVKDYVILFLEFIYIIVFVILAYLLVPTVFHYTT